MTKFVVAVVEDAPSYWTALLSDGSVQHLDATSYSRALEEADQRFGVAYLQQINVVDDEEV